MKGDILGGGGIEQKKKKKKKQLTDMDKSVAITGGKGSEWR